MRTVDGGRPEARGRCPTQEGSPLRGIRVGGGQARRRRGPGVPHMRAARPADQERARKTPTGDRERVRSGAHGLIAPPVSLVSERGHNAQTRPGYPRAGGRPGWRAPHLRFPEGTSDPGPIQPSVRPVSEWIVDHRFDPVSGCLQSSPNTCAVWSERGSWPSPDRLTLLKTGP